MAAVEGEQNDPPEFADYEEEDPGYYAGDNEAQGAAGDNYYDEDGNYYENPQGYGDGYDGAYDQGQWDEQMSPTTGMYSEGRTTCCKAFMTSIYPLMVTIILLNAALLVLGGVILGLGVDIMLGSKSQIAGFSQLEGVITSSPYVFAIVCIVLGALLIFFSILGIAISKFMAIGNPWGFIRFCYFCYQSFLILIVLILICTAVLAILGLALISGDDRYSETGWISAIRKDAMAACNQEYALDCAGYYDMSCVGSESAGTPFDFCPGRFCVDFCGVGNDEITAKDPDLCVNCMTQHDEAPTFFETCKRFELAKHASGCQENYNSYLTRTVTRVTILTVLSSVVVIVTIVFSSWKSCSCCQ